MNVYVIEDSYFFLKKTFFVSRFLWRESGISTCFNVPCLCIFQWMKKGVY